MTEKNIGSYLKKIRKNNGITLSKLAEESGVSQPYLSQIESGKRNPSYEIIRKLSDVLNVDFYDLAWRAGFYTDKEMEEVRYKRNYFESLTAEEEDAYFERENLDMLVEKYRKQEYPDVKDILNQRTVYFDGKSLNKENRELALKMLDLLFENLEVDYPSDEKIEKEYLDHTKYMKSMDNMFIKLKTE